MPPPFRLPFAALTCLLLLATPPLSLQAGQLPKLSDFSPAEISSRERARGKDLTVEAFGERFVIELHPNDALSIGLASAARDNALAGGRNAFYKGRIAARPASWARINRIGNAVRGMFSDGEHLYLIDQAEHFILPGERVLAPESTIVFRISDLVVDLLFDHGGVHLHAPDAPAADESSALAMPATAKRREGTTSAADLLPVTIVTDTEFTDAHGSDTQAIVLGRMNFVDGLYASQVGTGITLWHHEILTDNGSLISTDSGDLLDEFKQFLSSGDGSDIPFEGQAHLMTGRNIDDAAGYAYINVTCDTTYGIGVNQDLWSDTISALVVAHELGHNFGAGHDDDTNWCPEGTPAGIMNSMINPDNQNFSQCSLEAMTPNLETAPCLQLNPGFLFQDRFE